MKYLENIEAYDLSVVATESHHLSGTWRFRGLTANPYLLIVNVNWLAHTTFCLVTWSSKSEFLLMREID